MRGACKNMSNFLWIYISTIFFFLSCFRELQDRRFLWGNAGRDVHCLLASFFLIFFVLFCAGCIWHVYALLPAYAWLLNKTEEEMCVRVCDENKEDFYMFLSL